MHQRSGAPALRGKHARTSRRGMGVVAASALALVGGMLAPAAPATASPDDAAAVRLPSRAEVDAARQRVARTAHAVGAIQAALAAAGERLEAATVAAEQAAEAYNGARWRLHLATQRLQETRAAARRAAREVVDQRARVAGQVVGSYESAGALDPVEALLAPTGPAGVMGRHLASEGASASMQADLQRFTASSAVATGFSEQAADARERHVRLAARARAAQAGAAAAAQAAQAAAVQIDAERSRLVAELARAQGTSVLLARQRQAALEERARRAAEIRRARALARRPAQQAVPAETPPPAEPAWSEPPAEPAGSEPPAEPAGSEPPAEPAGSEPPAEPAHGAAPGAARAVAFARAQLGEAYVWGGAGPSTWDCSGLTMRAWQAAGVSLPHYSVAQYYATTPISAGALRPGDLVFWGSSSSPASIHHVAMYAGGGLVIHAPRTGRPVSVDSMYYWKPPGFFGRV